MRDYQRKKDNKYILPRAIWHATLWVIRDYDRMKAEAEAILAESPPPPDGLPKGSGTGDSTASKAIRRAELLGKCRAIEEALEAIPVEYRKGVWEAVTEWKRYPDDAARRTYQRAKGKFVYEAATRLKML